MAKETDDLLSEIRAVKMLMILQLLRQGVKQSQIAAMLGVSEPTMSRMLPKGIARSVSKGATGLVAEGAV
ncbi:MAG: lipoprotein [Phenylobacterium sp.]|nr:lipoprotein [Phenylobacterium sp.]